MSKITDPLAIRSVSLPNRLWFPPVARDLATADGLVTDDNVAAYRAIASGGVGTVVVEHSFVHPGGRYSAKQTAVDRDECVPGLARLAATIRSCGAVPILQLAFAGARTIAGRRVGPSAGPLPGETDAAVELSAAEIARVPGLFADAARRAREAGFAGAEVHAAHGFLLSEFLSPLANRRADGYGGDLRARARLALEVLEAARAWARDDFIVGVRLGADDGLAGGFGPEDAAVVGRWLQDAGADYLSISGALVGSRPKGLAHVQGFFFPHASSVKKNVTVPVVGVGGVTETAFARRAVADGVVDLVAVGRKLVAEPGWARRALEGG
jgi:2,4-dienoyl-CoA reductase-like NADH-dependent reductase (Old Yellow Enzyme family)